jgi:hypothetical protein
VRRAAVPVIPVVAGALLFVVYAATLAPDVTFWDAGEFIAAAHSLGIPHPPGTPLFILLLNAWARLFPWLPFAAGTNLFSAACTAFAAGLSAWLVVRATGDRAAALAAAAVAGGMVTVWSNATETEVYAAALALSIAAIAAGDRAGRSGETRWMLLAAYLMALSVPLHLSALVAAPVVVYLAAVDGEGQVHWRRAVMLTGVAVAAVAVSRMSWVLGIVALALIVIPSEGAQRRSRGTWDRRDWPRSLDSSLRSSLGMTVVVVTGVAFSALLFLLVRARHDPAINQGDPSTWSRLGDVVARKQYDVAPLWPRQAPVWIQLANWFEYADWQVALSLAPTVIPTVWRVAATLCFAALGVAGARWQRERDRRSWRAFAGLFVCGSIGVAAYLNLKAGASFAWSFIPDEARHEARDRDYFFALSFWTWGLWAGMGAVWLAKRWRLPSAAGVAVAGLPIVLNWTAVSRRSAPDADLPRMVARALLEPLPPRTVLFVAGDNDTYPLWYAQQVLGLRQDVTIVTMPLLGAAWYVRERARRDSLLVGASSGSTLTLAARAAADARRLGRPVAAALTVPTAERNHLYSQWQIIGDVAIGDSMSCSRQRCVLSVNLGIDSVRTRAWRDSIDAWRRHGPLRPSLDPVHEYFDAVLSCPAGALERPSPMPRVSPLDDARVKLDSLCNFR